MYKSSFLSLILIGYFVLDANMRNQLTEGDIVEFLRGTYSHYALYLGGNQVMNIQADSKKTSSLIKRESFDYVCGRSLVRVRNHDDVAMQCFGLKPKPFSEIELEAERYLDHTVPYELMFRNCEYYSTYWRFGKGFSTQVTIQKNYVNTQ